MDERRVNIGTPEALAQATVDVSKRAGAIQNRASGGLDLPRVSLFRQEAQEIPDSSWTAVALNFEEFDTHELHTTANQDELVFNAETAGVWAISMGVFWEPNTDASRRIKLLINGVSDLPQSIARIMAEAATADGAALVQSSFIASFQESDGVSFQVIQFSGVALDIQSAYLQGFRIGA